MKASRWTFKKNVAYSRRATLAEAMSILVFDAEYFRSIQLIDVARRRATAHRAMLAAYCRPMTREERECEAAWIADFYKRNPDLAPRQVR